MTHGVGFRDGLWCALVGVGLVRSWANRGECGGEVVEGPCARCARVTDGDGDEFNPPPIFVEGHNEGDVIFSLLCALLVASDVSREFNLYENEGALCFVEVG